MKAFFAACALMAIAAAAVAADDPVLTVLGEPLSAEAIPAPAEAKAAWVANHIRGAILRDYVARNGLQATAAEIAEVKAYDRDFERHDRAQRARKLEELDRRLAAPTLPAAERARLEDFRATLSRLAAYEAELDAKPAAENRGKAPDYGPWVEMWKMHALLYTRRGGVVGLASFGHYPHGAWASLVAEYEERGELRFHDPQLRDRVLALFNRPPPIVVPPGAVDFVPYWRKPIPPSYFPD